MNQKAHCRSKYLGHIEGIKEIASAAEVITGKPANIYCDEDIYTDVMQKKSLEHWVECEIRDTEPKVFETKG